MMGSAWAHGLDASAATQPPLGLTQAFQGFSNIVFTFGGHCMLMELVDSQFRWAAVRDDPSTAAAAICGDSPVTCPAGHALATLR